MGLDIAGGGSSVAIDGTSRRKNWEVTKPIAHEGVDPDTHLSRTLQLLSSSGLPAPDKFYNGRRLEGQERVRKENRERDYEYRRRCKGRSHSNLSLKERSDTMRTVSKAIAMGRERT